MAGFIPSTKNAAPPPPPASTFSLRLLSHSLPSPIYGGADWAALFSPTVDYSPFQNARKVLSASISLRWLVHEEPCQRALSHTSPRPPAIRQPPCAWPCLGSPRRGDPHHRLAPPSPRPLLSPFPPWLPRLPTNLNQFPQRWMDGRHREGRCRRERKEPPRALWGEPPGCRLQGECTPADNRKAPFPMGPRYYASRFDLFHMPSALSRGGGRWVCSLCLLSLPRKFRSPTAKDCAREA